MKGRVLTNGKPLEYFYVTLRSPNDSTVLYSGAFANGDFAFNDLKSRSYTLTITSLGYKAYTKTIKLSSSETNLGEINMETIALKIDEVVVSSSKKLFRQEKGQMIVSVTGTILSEAGSLIDVLKRSPGVIVDNENTLKIFGKGAPIIYIDNREVTSQKELEALQSSDIDKIIVDRNPSARYSASGQAVVIIKTKQAKKDQISVDIYNNTTKRRRFSNSGGFQINIKNRGWKNLLSYSMAANNYRDFIKSYEINHQPEYTINNLGDIVDSYSKRTHSIFCAGEYTLKSKHLFGFQFSGIINNRTSKKVNRQTYSATNAATIYKLISKNNKSNDNLYNTSLSYQFKPDSSRNNLLLILGYAYKDNRSDDIIDEKNLRSGTVIASYIGSPSRYDVYTSSLDYTFKLHKLDNIGVGLKFSQISNDGSSNQINRINNDLIYAQSSLINDRISAAYIKADEQFGKLLLSAGLRFEQTLSNIRIDNNPLKYSYSNFFPSMLAEYEHNKNFQTSLTYSRRIRRPGFSQINPNKYYFDAYSYGVGNPLLKPEYSDNCELSTTYKDVNLKVGYTSTLNSIAFIATNDETNPDIIKNTYLNLKRQQSLYVGISYAKSLKFYTGNVDLNFFKPFFRIPYLNKTISRNKPIWGFAFNNTFTLFKNLKYSCDLQYQSGGNNGITYYQSTCNLSTGLLWKLHNEKLTLSLFVNDILYKVNYNSWEDRYVNIVAGLKSRMDTRYIRLGIRYNFNSIKGAIKSKSNNSDELNRL